jgi:hypothetical protein
MGDPTTNVTNDGVRTVLHPVTDLAAATAVYTALLGVEPQGMTSPVAYGLIQDA